MLGIDRATPASRSRRRPFRTGTASSSPRTAASPSASPASWPPTSASRSRAGRGRRSSFSRTRPTRPARNNHPATLILRDGVQYFEAPGFGSVGVINVLVSHVTTPVEILDVSADFTSQPVAYQGSFACSDDALNTLWKSCRWSTQICLQTWHLDSPQHQEPISDYGDYLIADRVAFNAFGDNPALAQQDLRKWAWVMQDRDYHTFHTSYTLLWLQSLMQYYDYTGDLATVKELSPYVYGLLDRFAGYRGKNGLISEAPNYMFMDWVDIGGFRRAPSARRDRPGLHDRVLLPRPDRRRAGGRPDGRPRPGAAVRAAAGGSRRGLQPRTLGPGEGPVPGRQAVPDACRPEQLAARRQGHRRRGARRTTCWLCCTTSAPRTGSRRLSTPPWPRRRGTCGPTSCISCWTPLPTPACLTNTGRSGCGPVAVEHQPGNADQQEMGNQGDLSHGWIATPLIQMSERILGITPSSPAYKTISIRPTLCDLQWARGQCPHAARTREGLLEAGRRRPDAVRHRAVGDSRRCRPPGGPGRGDDQRQRQEFLEEWAGGSGCCGRQPGAPGGQHP